MPSAKADLGLLLNEHHPTFSQAISECAVTPTLSTSAMSSGIGRGSRASVVDEALAHRAVHLEFFDDA